MRLLVMFDCFAMVNAKPHTYDDDRQHDCSYDESSQSRTAANVILNRVWKVDAVRRGSLPFCMMASS